MNTPIYDSMVAERGLYPWALVDPRYYAKVTGEFPDAENCVADNFIPAKKVEDWGEPKWITTTLTVKTKPEPTWRTFLRCLFWWLP